MNINNKPSIFNKMAGTLVGLLSGTCALLAGPFIGAGYTYATTTEYNAYSLIIYPFRLVQNILFFSLMGLVGGVIEGHSRGILSGLVWPLKLVSIAVDESKFVNQYARASSDWDSFISINRSLFSPDSYHPFFLKLSKQNTNINEPMNNGKTPLYVASQQGDYYKLIQLLKNNAQQVPFISKATALRYSLKNESDIVRDKMDRVLKNKNSHMKNNEIALFPHEIAEIMGREPIINAFKFQLIDAICEKNEARALFLLSQVKPLGFSVHEADDSNNTALHHACKNNMLEVVNMLLSKGAIYHQKNKDGDTPLLIAARENHAEMVEKIIAHAGQNIGEYINQSDVSGNTALHYACLHNALELVPLLIQSGASQVLHNVSGDTPLHIAASCFFSKIVGALMALDTNNKIDFCSLNNADRTASFYIKEKREPTFLMLSEKERVQRLVALMNAKHHNQNAGPNTWLSMPPELIVLVAEHIPVQAKAALAQSCHSMYAFFKNDLAVQKTKQVEHLTQIKGMHQNTRSSHQPEKKKIWSTKTETPTPKQQATAFFRPLVRSGVPVVAMLNNGMPMLLLRRMGHYAQK